MPRQSHRIGIITHQGHRPRNRPTCAEPVEDIDANISFENSDCHHLWCFGLGPSFFFFFPFTSPGFISLREVSYLAGCPFPLSHLVPTPHLHAHYRRATNALSSSSPILPASIFFPHPPYYHNVLNFLQELTAPSSHALLPIQHSC